MPNGNQRGSTTDRRRRKRWLLSPAAGWGGDDDKVPCWECGRMLSFDTIYVDRIIPSHLGGTYRRSNIRPHCAGCSHREGQRIMRELAAATDPFT